MPLSFRVQKGSLMLSVCLQPFVSFHETSLHTWNDLPKAAQLTSNSGCIQSEEASFSFWCCSHWILFIKFLIHFCNKVKFECTKYSCQVRFIHLTINFNGYFMVTCLLCNSLRLLQGKIKNTTIFKIWPLIVLDFGLKISGSVDTGLWPQWCRTLFCLKLFLTGV